MPFRLPVRRLVLDLVPQAMRSWVDAAVFQPLNRNLEALEGALAKVGTDRLNVQWLEWRGLVPTSTAPVEFLSTLAGPCKAIFPAFASALDTGGTPSVPAGGLSTPTWEEVAIAGRNGTKLRLTSQSGLAGGTRYVVRWLAIGG